MRQAPHHLRQLPGLDVAAGELAGQRQCEKYLTLDEKTILQRRRLMQPSRGLPIGTVFVRRFDFKLT